MYLEIFQNNLLKNDNKFSKRHDKIAGLGSSPEIIKKHFKNKKFY